MDLVLLQMPLEDILLLHHSLTSSAGSLWPWLLTVLTAALALLGIRVVGSRSTTKPDVTTRPSETPRLSAEVLAVKLPAPATRPPACEGEGASATISKARFTGYYSYDACTLEDEEKREQTGGGVNWGVDPPAPWEGKEVRWAEDISRRWDLGWYLFQERTMLNGSVVRFWAGDDNGGLTTPRGLRRRF